MQLKWVRFHPERGSRQKLPLEHRLVLVHVHEREDKGLPPGVGVGYLRFAAGDKHSPYFVIPAMGGECHSWCDCLGDDFTIPPLWKCEQVVLK